jgi:hypothetical protein
MEGNVSNGEDEDLNGEQEDLARDELRGLQCGGRQENSLRTVCLNS